MGLKATCLVEEYHLNQLKTVSPCQQHGCCQMIPTNLGLVNHSFIHRGVIFNLFPHSLLCKVALMLNPCRLIASTIIFVTATASILFKNRNQDQEVWTLERAETILFAMERLGLRLGLCSVVLSEFVASQTFGERFGATRILVGSHCRLHGREHVVHARGSCFRS